MAIDYEAVMERLKSLADPTRVEMMRRHGIDAPTAYGISISALRKLAGEAGRDHALASRLWGSGIHEARMLACMVDDPRAVTEEQMEAWAADFDSWDVCDQCCMDLFDATPFAYDKAVAWSGREEEYVKRAAFALMAGLAIHDKKAPDERFIALLPFIMRECVDERNYVKKAVSWALRNIGKRNLRLNELAVEKAGEMKKMDSRSGRWIGSGAVRELTGDKVQERLRRRGRGR